MKNVTQAGRQLSTASTASWILFVSSDSGQHYGKHAHASRQATHLEREESGQWAALRADHMTEFSCTVKSVRDEVRQHPAGKAMWWVGEQKRFDGKTVQAASVRSGKDRMRASLATQLKRIGSRSSSRV